MLLVVVDAYSKWLVVEVTTHVSSSATFRLLRQMFCKHKLPKTVVSNIGSCFTSEDFQGFLAQNRIRHAWTSPYHPSPNGLAERAVQTVKLSLEKQSAKCAFQLKLSRFLLSYRVTLHSTTRQAPCELLVCRLQTQLDLVRSEVTKRQELQARWQGNFIWEYNIWESVYIHDYPASSTGSWQTVCVTERTGNRLVTVAQQTQGWGDVMLTKLWRHEELRRALTMSV